MSMSDKLALLWCDITFPFYWMELNMRANALERLERKEKKIELAEREAALKRGTANAGNVKVEEPREKSDSSEKFNEIRIEYLKKMEKFISGEFAYEEHRDTYEELYTEIECSGIFDNHKNNELWCKFKDIPFNS